AGSGRQRDAGAADPGDPVPAGGRTAGAQARPRSGRSARTAEGHPDRLITDRASSNGPITRAQPETTGRRSIRIAYANSGTATSTAIIDSPPKPISTKIGPEINAANAAKAF